VLEGSVRRAAGRVRITCQLIEAATNHHVWADRFEGKLEDVFDLQDRVTESIVGAVEPSLQRAEIERASLKPTENLAAYDLYLRSLPHLYSMTRNGNNECLRLLQEAVVIDPSYSLAKAMIAFCHAHRCAQNWASESDRSEAIRLAHEALMTHRDDPITLRCLALALAYVGREYDLACTALDRAMALNPNSAVILNTNGYVRTYVGDLAAAEQSFTRAIRLSPLDPEMGIMLSGLSFTYSRQGRFEDGLKVSPKAVREMPAWVPGYHGVIRNLVALGRVDEARSFGMKLLQISPDFSIRSYLKSVASRDKEYVSANAHALRLAGIPE
jgi:adenylate cyclase